MVAVLRTTGLAITAALIGALALVVFAAAFGADVTRLVTFLAATFFLRTGLTFSLETILLVFAVIFLAAGFLGAATFLADLTGFTAAVFDFDAVLSFGLEGETDFDFDAEPNFGLARLLVSFVLTRVLGIVFDVVFDRSESVSLIRSPF